MATELDEIARADLDLLSGDVLTVLVLLGFALYVLAKSLDRISRVSQAVGDG